MTPVLEIKKVYKNFGGVKAIDDFSCCLEQERIHGLIGPNGAGKTTIFNNITGIYLPTSGKILFMNEDITGKKRSQNIVYPRQIAMYLCRKLLSLSLPKIGDGFNGRDHSTVIHGCDKISELIESDVKVKSTVIEIEKLII